MNHRACILAMLFCLTAPTIDAAGPVPVFVFPPPIGSDNFNDNVQSPVNWGAPTLLGAGRLTEINQRLEYTTSGAPTVQDFAAWDWNLYGGGGPGSQSWTFQIDISMPHLSLIDSSRFALYGLQVPRAIDSFFFYVMDFNSDGTETRQFVAQTPAGSVTAATLPDTTVQAMRLRFDGSNGTLSADYDPNGPTDGYQWTNLTNAPGFGSGTISVFAQSANISLSSSSNVYADNVMAVPEPSSYALMLAGLGLIGWVVRRYAALASLSSAACTRPSLLGRAKLFI